MTEKGKGILMWGISFSILGWLLFTKEWATSAMFVFLMFCVYGLTVLIGRNTREIEQLKISPKKKATVTSINPKSVH